MRKWRVEVIFDSYMTSEPPSRTGNDAVAVVFTGSRESCDTYMERVSVELNRNDTAFVAATNDNAIKTVVLANGGLAMSASRFLQEIKIARKEAMHFASLTNSRNALARGRRNPEDYDVYISI